ncbi:terpene synthase family protein [Micromonospora sp. NBC_01796]|uniref:terpene synthase family protein n=1 Tax=Micromonospora sp. NBC_01796 TaxID=2975987 RepID=UPI002DD89DCB|nr:terpene synthase family protein [Micromonospora sp. NBC_01796]WSA84255.1 terpene synthase family protein [Micromonospora sp. NBC_01796]
MTAVATRADATRDLSSGAELAAIGVLTMAGQRDLTERVRAYPDLFAGKPFDAALIGGVAYATACNMTWATSAELRVANRAALWVFALDWQVDTLAVAAEQVDEIAANCLAVADGAVPGPGSPLAGFLADIRDELVTAPAFAAYAPLWRADLRRTLAAMSREWGWKSARAAGEESGLPDVDTYLDAADNTGLSWVNLSHWLRTGEPDCLDVLDELRSAGERVQRVLRLVNDLATYDRDVSWGGGDLNVLMLGVDRAWVAGRVAELVDGCLELIAPLRTSCPREASYLARQLGFVTRFYGGGADFWGRL